MKQTALRWPLGWRLGLAGGLCAAHPAGAAPPPLSVPVSGGEQNGLDGGQGFSGFLGDLQRTSYLLGDLFGLRTTLAKYGVSLAFQETSEVLGNATGGIHRGADYDGLTQMILQLDAQRAFGWYGGLLNISALQIHGRNLSADALLSLQTASGIEADRSTRLWEAWYDQKLLPDDRLDIRLGQQSVDQEFISSANGAVFVNTMFGWPLVPSVDLPGGGPAYPLSALGVRVRYRPVNAVAVLAGIFSGNPAPDGTGYAQTGNAQVADASGTSFPTRGRLVFAELQYTYPALGSMVYPGEGAPLGHTYKLGAWYDSERFPDQFDTGHRALNAGANGNALQHRGDYSIYAVADQMVWRKKSDPNQSLSVFARAMGTPQADRNLADLSINAGVVLHDPVVNRSADTLAVGMGYAHVSSRASALDRQTAASAASGTGGFTPVRSGELFFEATYQYQVHPWWQVQPDVQYVLNPGGGIANPNAPDKRVDDELVLGLRTNVLF